MIPIVWCMMQWLEYIKANQQAFQKFLAPAAPAPAPITHHALLPVIYLAPKVLSVSVMKPNKPDIQVTDVHLKSVYQRLVSILARFL